MAAFGAGPDSQPGKKYTRGRTVLTRSGYWRWGVSAGYVGPHTLVFVRGGERIRVTVAVGKT